MSLILQGMGWSMHACVNRKCRGQFAVNLKGYFVASGHAVLFCPYCGLRFTRGGRCAASALQNSKNYRARVAARGAAK